jgi:hypothetical protein
MVTVKFTGGPEQVGPVAVAVALGDVVHVRVQPAHDARRDMPVAPLHDLALPVHRPELGQGPHCIVVLRGLDKITAHVSTFDAPIGCELDEVRTRKAGPTRRL